MEEYLSEPLKPQFFPSRNRTMALVSLPSTDQVPAAAMDVGGHLNSVYCALTNTNAPISMLSSPLNSLSTGKYREVATALNSRWTRKSQSALGVLLHKIFNKYF